MARGRRHSGSNARPPGPVPAWLQRCEVCGELRGRGRAPDPPDDRTSSRANVLCLCDGLVCGSCGQDRIHRPISDRYDEETGQVWHVPYFMGLKRCRVCGAQNWVRNAENARPSQVADTPRPTPASQVAPTESARPSGQGARTIVLFAGALPSGLTSHAEVHVDAAGDLILEVQDLGQQLVELFGDTDYEWWVVVRAAHKQNVLERLLGRQPDSSAAEHESDADALLLSLIGRRFGGRPSAPSDLKDWLRESGIPYELSSYA